jgi:hypothetical protein
MARKKIHHATVTEPSTFHHPVLQEFKVCRGLENRERASLSQQSSNLIARSQTCLKAKKRTISAGKSL